AEYRQRLRNRTGDLQTLPAAHPVRDLDRLGVHVLEAVLLHLRERPLNCRLEVGRSAEAVAEGVAEEREALPCEVRRDRLAHEPARGIAVRGEPFRRAALR